MSETTERKSQKQLQDRKGFYDLRDGWYLGADIGYNLLMFGPKAHWLSLMVRYDWNIDDSMTEGVINDGRISVNLVYNLRGYYTD